MLADLNLAHCYSQWYRYYYIWSFSFEFHLIQNQTLKRMNKTILPLISVKQIIYIPLIGLGDAVVTRFIRALLFELLLSFATFS